MKRSRNRRASIGFASARQSPPASRSHWVQNLLINNDERNDMHLFEVSGQGMAPLPVFAVSYDEAVELALAWWIFRHQHQLPDLEVRRRNVRWPGLNVDHLTDALDREIAGIGYYDPDAGWTIRSPGYIE
jgi:hypothetical protein